MSDELITWLRAQLDEDERTARSDWEWRGEEEPWSTPPMIAAKRAILDAGGPHVDPDIEPSDVGDRIKFAGWDSPTCSDNCGPDVWWAVVRLLASAYSSRPGYQEAWRP